MYKRQVLAGLPVATTIGNHDSLNADYMYHFNNPNATEYGATQAGGDYYYSYGNGLFIVLNTNNYNVAEHEQAIQEAIASDPNAAWRIVTIHQDIYGSGLDHSDTDGMILRTQLTPIFDEYDIDVVLQGHDHTYSRSNFLFPKFTQWCRISLSCFTDLHMITSLSVFLNCRVPVSYTHLVL